MLSPNGGESYANGSVQVIQWISNTIDNIRLDYSTNGGSTWTLVSPSEPGMNGVYSWTVPGPASVQALVRASDVLNSTTIRDQSNSTFVIGSVLADKYFGGSYDGHAVNVNQSASITVVSPNTGSEVWYEGNQASILWNSTNVVLLDIEGSTNNGSSWFVIDTAVTAGSGAYTWQVGSYAAQSSALIRLTDRSNVLIRDTSNLGFTIPLYSQVKNQGGGQDGWSQDVNAANIIQVLSPNGGEMWAENSVQQIQWTANNISNVRLEYSTNNGSNWILISANEAGNTGSYSWLVPSTATGSARVRVLDLLNQSTVRDISDTTFVIGIGIADKYYGGSYDGADFGTVQQSTITVVSPNTGSEVWYEGNPVIISWTNNNVSLVNIEISSNNGSTWLTIDTSISAGLGQYTWIVSGNYSQGQALIRVSDRDFPIVTRDTSNAPFTIPQYVQDKNRGGQEDGYSQGVNAGY